MESEGGPQMKPEKSFLIRKGCDSRQIGSRCVARDEHFYPGQSPVNNPESMFVNTLTRQERWKFISEILTRVRRGQSPGLIAKEMFTKKRTVQRVIRDHSPTT